MSWFRRRAAAPEAGAPDGRRAKRRGKDKAPQRTAGKTADKAGDRSAEKAAAKDAGKTGKAVAKVRSGAEVLVDRPDGRRLRWRPAATIAGALLLPPLAVALVAVAAPQDAEALLYEGGAELAEISASGGLAVDAVTVEGRGKTALDELREAIGVNRGDPILFLDLEEVRSRVADLPWVKSAVVERRLPDTLHVRLEEREPFVRWQNGGRTVLIDREGVILAKAVGGEFRHLRRLVGKGAPQQAAALFDLLQDDLALFARVATATRIRERRWDITFDNGVVVRLPEEGMRQAWHRFAELQASEGLLDKDIRGIDLRVPDRVILQLTPEAVQARDLPGKNT